MRSAAMLDVPRISYRPSDRMRFRRRLLWIAFSSGLILFPFLVVIGIGGLQIRMLRSRLQSAADALATAEAARLSQHVASEQLSMGRQASMDQVTPVAARKESVQTLPGFWDFAARRFHEKGGAANAVRVVVSGDSRSLDRLGRWVATRIGAEWDIKAQAVAAVVPRDIVFLVDLSGAMNDDTEPAWAPAAQSSSTSGTAGSSSRPWLQEVYDDFGFGSYPGEAEYFGGPWGVSAGVSAYAELTRDRGPLAAPSVPELYRILPTDDPWTRKRKAYSAVIDAQIARLMPHAMPEPDSRTTYEFWASYLDYLLIPVSAAAPSAEAALLPPAQSANRLDRFRNPDRFAYPRVTPEVLAESAGRIGYRTYVQFMMDFGRNLKPTDSLPVPLSRRNRDCPLHAEAVPGGVISFPPREQPMHAVRRALIAALHVMLERNTPLADAELQDRVAVIGYDAPQSGGAIVLQDLTADYGSAIEVCTQLQAGSDKPSREDVAAGLRAGLRAAREVTSGGSIQSSPVRRDQWLVLIRYDGDGTPGLAAAGGWVENAERDRNTILPAGFGKPSRPERDETAELIDRLRLEGFTLHTFTVGPADSTAERSAAAKDRGAILSGTPRRETMRDLAEVQAKLTEFLSKLASSPRVRLVQ